MLLEKMSNLEEEIEELESKISKDANQEKLDSIMNKINLQMSKWSVDLDIEYENVSIRFNPKQLMIYADTDEKSIPLNKMGSGANWVSYHLLIHFALHKHFINSKRPVPRFIFLDQPSQVYYPPERNSKKPIKSSDEIAVAKMFDFIFKIIEETKGKFQIIITDHAEPNNKVFKSNTIERWRDGKKLVPVEWQDKRSSTTNDEDVNLQ